MEQSKIDHDGPYDSYTARNNLSSPIVDDLIERCKTMLSELEAFRTRLHELRKQGSVEIAHFRGTVQSELGMLERLSQKPESESTNHVARSSNLPFLEHVWSAAKQSKDLTALQKRVYVNSSVKSLSKDVQGASLNGNRKNSKHQNENAVVIDAITDAGRKWIKISLVTNTRLLFDLAKQGWEMDDSENDNSESESRDNEYDDDRDVPLLKTAKELTRASKQSRVRTKYPSVHFILPRIQPGETHEIDAILEKCRACGAEVYCGPDLRAQPTLEAALISMASDPLSNLSETLNVDCTILLALVSDFSHASVAKEPWFHAALQRQVEIEDNENLLPSLLYPAMSDHKLVCTREAASRMREIVDTIGTVSEKARTAIIMGYDSSKHRADLINEIQQWSAYSVPKDWQLPIQVVDQNEDDCQSNLPSISSTVSDELTAINQSVFLYGWASGNTTITSNRAVVKQIENKLEKLENLDDEAWPKIWLCPTARSLVGKEKRGGTKESKAKAMRLPDPLHREEHRRNGLDVLSMREGYEVEDLLPNGHPCEEVLEAKNAAQWQ